MTKASELAAKDDDMVTFNSPQEAKNWITQKIASTSTTNEAKAAWGKFLAKVDGYYNDGKKLVVDDKGNMDLSGLADWAKAKGEDLTAAYETLKKTATEKAGTIADWIGDNWPMLAAVAAPLAGMFFFETGTLTTLLLGAASLAGAAILSKDNKDSILGQVMDWILKATGIREPEQSQTPAPTTPDRQAEIDALKKERDAATAQVERARKAAERAENEAKEELARTRREADSIPLTIVENNAGAHVVYAQNERASVGGVEYTVKMEGQNIRINNNGEKVYHFTALKAYDRDGNLLATLTPQDMAQGAHWEYKTTTSTIREDKDAREEALIALRAKVDEKLKAKQRQEILVVDEMLELGQAKVKIETKAFVNSFEDQVTVNEEIKITMPNTAGISRTYRGTLTASATEANEAVLVLESGLDKANKPVKFEPPVTITVKLKDGKIDTESLNDSLRDNPDFKRAIRRFETVSSTKTDKGLVQLNPVDVPPERRGGLNSPPVPRNNDRGSNQPVVT